MSAALSELDDSHPMWLDRRRAWALFLDIDGTMIDIRSKPAQVFATSSLVRVLRDLRHAFDGAVAVLSGRPIADIDRIFHPLRLACAGVHGAQLRDGDGGELAGSDDHAPVQDGLFHGQSFLDEARARLRSFVARHPSALVEDKGVSLALHTRLAPGAGLHAQALMLELAGASQGRYVMLRGKEVHELLPAGFDKGRALERLLRTPPFAGRTPVAVGDDVTDVAAFQAVSRHDGLSIAVGPGAQPAMFKLASPQECRRWLQELVVRHGVPRTRR